MNVPGGNKVKIGHFYSAKVTVKVFISLVCMSDTMSLPLMVLFIRHSDRHTGRQANRYTEQKLNILEFHSGDIKNLVICIYTRIFEVADIRKERGFIVRTCV